MYMLNQHSCDNMANLPDDDLPSSFDVVVDGTGLVQSILAAALARAGKSVLHIDRQRYYGEQWASLMHRELQQWMADLEDTAAGTSDNDTTPPPASADEDWVTLKNVLPNITNIQQVVPQWMPSESDGQQLPTEEGAPHSRDEQRQSETSPDNSLTDNSQQEPQSNLDGPLEDVQGESPNSEQQEAVPPAVVQSPAPVISPNQQIPLNWDSLDALKRRLTYDILPKVLYCRGSLVDLLTHSNCGRYVEFKAVSKIFTQVNGELEQVPCSRADMFSTKSLSMVDKRKMMRFLSFCAEYESHPEQYQEVESLPFVEFLTKNDLHANLRKYIVHCIAMVEETTPTIEALKATQLFLGSLGRFGNAPFLYPIFGVGELPQAFCRLCAVFGGIYCLRRHIQSLVVSTESHNVKAIICSTGQRISCSTAVCSASNLATTFQLNDALTAFHLSRAIFITDGPITNTQGSLTLMTLPPCALGTHQPFVIRMLQLDSSTNTAAPGTYMVHVMCPSVGSSAEVDLQPVCGAYFSTPGEVSQGKPRLLYALYFNATLHKFNQATAASASIDGLPSNVLLTSDPAPSVTFEGAVDEARKLFDRLCPGEEFLPPPPDPDDIIYDDEPSQAEGVDPQ